MADILKNIQLSEEFINGVRYFLLALFILAIVVFVFKIAFLIRDARQVSNMIKESKRKSNKKRRKK